MTTIPESKILGPDGQPYAGSSTPTGLPTNDYAFVCGGERGDVRIKSPADGLRHPGVWRCVHYLASRVGKTPLQVVDADLNVITRHPASYLIEHEPNARQSAYTWKYITTQHAAYWGESISYIVRDRESSRPKAIIPFTPDNAAVCRIYEAKTGRHRTLYSFFVGNEWVHGVAPMDVYHLLGWTHNGVDSVSFWKMHAQTIGLGTTAQEFAATYYSGGANPLAIIKKPLGLPPDPKHPKNIRFMESFRDAVQGFGRKYRVLMIENNSDYIPASDNAESSQMHDAREVSLREVANLFGLPPFTVGLDQQGPYKSIAEKVSLEIEALNHWFCLHESEARKKLLRENEKLRRTRSVMFARDTLFDISTQVDIQAKKVEKGLATTDEARQSLHMPKVGAEGGGNLLMVSRARVPLQTLVPASAPGAAAGGEQLELVEAVQKVYLGVGKVISADEARKMLNDGYGADLPIPGAPAPEPTTDDPEALAELDWLRQDAYRRAELIITRAIERAQEHSDASRRLEELRSELPQKAIAPLGFLDSETALGWAERRINETLSHVNHQE